MSTTLKAHLLELLRTSLEYTRLQCHLQLPATPPEHLYDQRGCQNSRVTDSIYGLSFSMSANALMLKKLYATAKLLSKRNVAPDIHKLGHDDDLLLTAECSSQVELFACGIPPQVKFSEVVRPQC